MNLFKKIILTIILIISIIPYCFLMIGAMNSYLHGIGGTDIFGVSIPFKSGIDGLIQYFSLCFSPKWLGILYIPVYLGCFIYQIIYFKIITKIKKKEEKRD